MSGTSDLVRSAALFRVDVYDATVACAGSVVTPNAPAALFSYSFAPDEPITLDVPPGAHTIAITAWADASGTTLLGGGCRADVDLTPGAQICLDVTIDGVDLGVVDDLADAMPADLIGRVDGGNVCPPFAHFCDDFEDGLINFPGREEVGPGQIAADSVRPHHANLALHAATHPDPSDASTDLYNRQRAKRSLSTPAAAGTTFAMRAYVWFSFLSGSPAARLFQLSNETGSSVALGVQNGNWGIGSSWTAPTSTTPVAQSRWLCLEWIVDLATQGRVQILVDGTQVLDSQQQTADPADAYDSLMIGLRAEKQGGAEVFIDDLVYGSQRIGCPP